MACKLGGCFGRHCNGQHYAVTAPHPMGDYEGRGCTCGWYGNREACPFHRMFVATTASSGTIRNASVRPR
jgi:hypothetical protein